MLVSEKCGKCDYVSSRPRWQQCKCLTNAFDSLCKNAFQNLPDDQIPPTLVVSVVGGWIKATENSTAYQFDPSDIRAVFQADKMIISPPNGMRGAKPITSEAKELWLERRKKNQCQASANREAEFIHRILTERHQKTGRKVPSSGTIRKRIGAWLEELSAAE